MANVNNATLSGNLTRDPELRHTPSGVAVCNLGLAVNRRYKDENAEGGYAEEVSFFDIIVWGSYGELTARKLQKGDSITVQGRLKQNRWEAEDGSKRSKVELIADQIDSEGYFRAKDDEKENDSGSESAPEAAPASETKAAPGKDDIPF
jgi:single-strand DNA-binding protein